MNLRHLWSRLRRRLSPLPEIDAGLWLATVQAYPFLGALALADQAKLRALAALFGIVNLDRESRRQVAARGCVRGGGDEIQQSQQKPRSRGRKANKSQGGRAQKAKESQGGGAPKANKSQGTPREAKVVACRGISARAEAGDGRRCPARVPRMSRRSPRM